VRTRVPNKERERTLFSLTLRRHYDARLNVWDVCKYFDFGEPCPGGGYDGYDTDDSDDEGDTNPLECPPPPSPSQNPDTIANEVDNIVVLRLQGPLCEATAVQPELNLLESQPVDTSQYLLLLYGFLWPLPYPTVNITADTVFWEMAIKNIGLCSTTAPHATMPAAILAFLRGLCSKKPEVGPPNALFDLSSTSRAPISCSAIQHKIPKVGNLFIVQSHVYQREEHCDWLVALTSAADAVRAFHLLSMDTHSPASLSVQLVNLGITFHTLRCLPFSPTTILSSPPTLIPVCVRDHVFMVNDHSAYVERRACVLSSPRGRAVLLAGGLIWRLALEHLGMESVGLGPSTVVQNGIGYVFEAPNRQVYGDDGLTKDELEVICGLYRCYTGMENSLTLMCCILLCHLGQGNQQALCSWWPLPNKWFNHTSNGFYWGHWTELDEEWFQNHSRKISKGLAQPKKLNEWQDILKGGTAWRTTVDWHLKAAENLYN